MAVVVSFRLLCPMGSYLPKIELLTVHVLPITVCLFCCYIICRIVAHFRATLEMIDDSLVKCRESGSKKHRMADGQREPQEGYMGHPLGSRCSQHVVTDSVVWARGSHRVLHSLST